MRTEKEIREKIAEIDERQKQFSWDGYAPQGFIDRQAHAKTTLRAQMKGLYHALGENEDFRIVGDD